MNANRSFVQNLWLLSRIVKRMPSLLLSEKEYKNSQQGVDDQGRAILSETIAPGGEQEAENEGIPSRNQQNRERQLTGRLLFSRCHERHKGKNQRIHSVQQSELGIRQRGLSDSLENTRRKHEHNAENRQIGCSDV